jgi:hypothetical protein
MAVFTTLKRGASTGTGGSAHVYRVSSAQLKLRPF